MGYYNRKPSPCYFRGRLYRSRHEARWHIFFERMGINVEYEPTDFKGWSPDFLILSEYPIYVEIKPYLSISYMVGCSDKLTKAMRLDSPCYEHEAKAIICTNPIEPADRDQILFGYQACPFDKLDPLLWKYDYDVSSFTYDWTGILKGKRSKNFLSYNSIERHRIEHLWNECGNDVQFLKPI